MTPQEAINHGKEQLEIFGGEHKEFIKVAIEALEQQPSEDCISLNKLDDIITKAIDESENQTECQTLRWVLDVMSELPSVVPKQKVGKWILTDVEGNRVWHCSCSECGKDPQDYIGGSENWWLIKNKLPKYCPKCGSYNGGEQNDK